MVAIATALVTGILAGYGCEINIAIAAITGAVSLIGMFLTRKTAFFTACAAVFFISLGSGLITVKQQQQKLDINDRNEVFQLLISDYPTIKNNSVRVESRLIDNSGKEHKIMFSTVLDSASRQLTIGDFIVVNGQLSLPRPLNPEGFDYGRYLKMQGYSASVYSTSWQLLRHTGMPKGLQAWGRRQQHRVTEYYKKCGFEDRELGVVCALTIGERDFLDDDTRSAFSKAGAIHVLAVSGLHVGIIYGILLLIFTLFGRFKPRRDEWWLAAIQSAVIIVLLWSFAIITGLSPSIVRATLMFSLGEIGRNLHKTDFGLNIVGASAVISLIVNPLALFSVSFQLSYSAVISIMTIGQKFDRWATIPLKRTKEDKLPLRICKRIARYITGILTISIAAQIGTLPLTLYYFKQASIWFWLTNLFVLPFAQWIAFYILILLPFCPEIPRFAYQIMCDYIFWIESLPHSTIQLWIGSGQTILLFCILITAYHKRLHYIAAVLTLVFIGTYVYQQHTNRNTRELIIYADRKADVIQLINGNDQTLLTNDSARAQYLTAQTGLKHNLNAATTDSTTKALIINKIGKVIIINDSILQNKTLTEPAPCNILILGDIGHVGAERLLSNIDCNEIILLGTMKTWKRKQFIQICKSNNIPYHDVITQGAVIYKFDKQ